MKKITVILSAVAIAFAFLSPVSLGNLNSDSFLSVASAKSAKVSKKTKKKRDKDTKQRTKRLKSIGIPKSFYDGDYGSSMSLAEMGKIVAEWIVTEYARTGQIPPLDGDDSNWLVLKVNGQCQASDKACARWSGSY